MSFSYSIVSSLIVHVCELEVLLSFADKCKYNFETTEKNNFQYIIRKFSIQYRKDVAIFTRVMPLLFVLFLHTAN